MVLKQGRDDSALSSLRAYNQITPTTKTVVRILLLRHPLLLPNITRHVYAYLSACAVGFERIFTCKCESFFS